MPPKELIIIVDDDPIVRQSVTDLLTSRGFATKSAASAFQARGLLLKSRPDLLILDRRLPDAEGVNLLEEIRVLPGCASLPVLFLTGKNSPSDQVEGLESGDDYLAKPFIGKVLLARIKALLRRTRRPPEPTHALRAFGLEINVDRRTVHFKKKLIELRAKEFDLLVTLMEKPGHVFSRSYLLQNVWRDEELNKHIRTVDVTVGRLRAALGPLGKRIVTVQPYGYRFEGE